MKQKMTLKCEVDSEDDLIGKVTNVIVLDQGASGSGFAALICEYARIHGHNPKPDAEHELAQMIAAVVLGQR